MRNTTKSFFISFLHRRTGQPAECIFMVNSSFDAVLGKEVPFGGYNYKNMVNICFWKKNEKVTTSM
jgi:hypothetical protein